MKLNDVALQPVGFAFTYIARYLDFNDRDLNSVAAENAVYCLGKSLIANNNTFCAPALFTLFLNYSDLLNDKFFATYLYHVYWGIGIKEIPFHRRLPILLYLYSFFYDEQKQIYTVSSNVPFHFPTDENLREFQNLKKQIGASNEELYSEGENCFFRIFEECQSALYNMKNM